MRRGKENRFSTNTSFGARRAVPLAAREQRGMVKDMKIKLRGNGLPPPEGFPTEPYNKIYDVVLATNPTHPLYEHWSGAWMALAYRYCAAVDCGAQFADLCSKHGASPGPEHRYLQEKALFEFFSTGFSAFECTFYGLYAIGAFVAPASFVLSSERDQQRISPASTKDAFWRAFPNDPILTAFSALFADSEYRRWKEIRNVLTHRTAPGRRIYVSIGGDEDLPTEWKLTSSPLDASIVAMGLDELSRLVTNLVSASSSFVEAKCK